MAPKRKCYIPAEADVKQRWAALDTEKRKVLMVFDDQQLVERIQESLQNLFAQHTMMQELGIALAGQADPFTASTILRECFTFSWQISKSRSNPGLVRMDSKRPIMEMKTPSLEREELLHDLRTVLPDFLSTACGRCPLPRARWKDLWATKPQSVQAIEQQLVKLIEQALWAMATDPAYAVSEETDRSMKLLAMEGDSVRFEQWMEDCDAKTRKSEAEKLKKKSKQNRNKRSINSKCSTPLGIIGKEHKNSDADDDDDREEDFSPSRLAAHRIHGDLDEAASDGEIRMGTLHMAESSTCTPADTSLVSTPVHCPRSPPTSPCGPHTSLDPSSLVCYVWSQTAANTSFDGEAHEASFTPQGQPATPSASGTPTSQRGGRWIRCPGGTPESNTPVPTAVVRTHNTFLDVDQPRDTVERRARSLSPNLNGLCDRCWYETL